MLDQLEADRLMNLKKYFVTNSLITLKPGLDKSFDVISYDKHELFHFDIWRGVLRITKLKYQNRARRAIVLARLDINASPHTNPDGSKVGKTHIHIYREGDEDKWAYELETQNFATPYNNAQLLKDFCKLCNIDKVPPMQSTLI